MILRTDEWRYFALRNWSFRAREASLAGFSANELESTHVSVQLPLGLVFAMSQPFAVGGEGEASAVVATLGEGSAAASTLSEVASTLGEVATAVSTTLQQLSGHSERFPEFFNSDKDS